MRRLFAMVALMLVAGCAADAASPTDVEDLRVLAIRAEPPELLFDRDGAAAQEVTFSALVVDPRGLPTPYDWAFCPVESSQTCTDFAGRELAAPPEARAVLDTARAQAAHGQADSAPDHLGAMAVGPFVAHVEPALFAYHAASSALGMGNGAWLSAALALGGGLAAEKRVVLNARELSQWNPELAAQGWQICPPPPVAPPAGCLPLLPRAANRNPEIMAVEVAHSLGADASFEPLSGPLTLAPKQQVRLRPVIPADAAEHYQTVEATFEGDRLVVVDHQEELVVSWFATAGTFAHAQTVPELTRTLDNTFTAPPAPPAATGGKLSVYLVVRDQRGGTGWARIEAIVVP